MFKDYNEAVEFIKKTHQKYKLKIKAPYSVEFSNRMRSCLGRCREFRLCGKPIRYTFTYNNKFIKANLSNDKIQGTVLHEIAHAIVGNELINDFKDDTSLQNALKNKDKAWLTDIILHRPLMSMHLYGFNTEYLSIKGYNYDELKIFFDENLNIKSAYYYADDKEYSINIDKLK